MRDFEYGLAFGGRQVAGFSLGGTDLPINVLANSGDLTLASDAGGSKKAVTCGAGLIADSVSGKCVTPCSDGSAPAGLVCPSTPVTTPATTISTATYVIGGVVAVAVIVGIYYATRK